MEKNELKLKLKEIGLKKGDTLFLRISYKSLGIVDGGPKTVIEALKEIVGETGNLIVTAFGNKNMSPFWFRRIFQKKIILKPHLISNIKTGIIPITLAKYKDVIWSTHPTFPFIAWGANAKEITKEHTSNSQPYDLLKNICENYNGKTLRIGGYILTGTTHISFSEAMKSSHSYQRLYRNRIYYYDETGKLRLNTQRQAAFCFETYDNFFRKNIKGDAIIYHGPFFKTEATLINMKETLRQERILIGSHPEKLLCNNIDCSFCPHTFSYSRHKLDYFIIRINRILLLKRDISYKAFKEAIRYLLNIIFIKRDIQ